MGIKKQNQKKLNYFRQNAMKLGSDFISKMNARDLEERASKRIINDIAYNNIDVNVDGQFFYSPELINAMIKYATTQFNIAQYNYMGNVLLVQNGYNDPVLTSIMEYNLRRRDAYQIVLNNLYGFGQTGNIEYINVMRNQLMKYKQNI